MNCHHCIYHLPFLVLFHLTPMGFLTKRSLELQNKPPLCVACKFGAAHRCPWRQNRKKSGLIRRLEQTNPGDGVLVDQIVSDQPGIIPQMSEFLTSHRFWGCTNFVDHVSKYVYVHIMRDLSIYETLLTKEALEKRMAQSRQTFKHYQAENLRFSENVFIDAINQKDQKITFCVVGAHYRNGIVKNKNKIMTTGARNCKSANHTIHMALRQQPKQLSV